jgi:hypothetical protein
MSFSQVGWFVLSESHSSGSSSRDFRSSLAVGIG